MTTCKIWFFSSIMGDQGLSSGYQALQQVPLLGEAISLALGL